MIPFFFEVSPAYAQEDTPSQVDLDAALESRLLGEIEEVNPESGARWQGVETPQFTFWIMPFFIVVVALLFFSKWKKELPIGEGEIRILSKKILGKEGSLAIVEVGEGDRGRKRLLIGLHENSTPRLIDHLSLGSENFDEMLDRLEVEASVKMPDNITRTIQPSPSVKEIEPMLQEGEDLLSEIYQARGIRQYKQATSTTSEAPASVRVQEEDEDPWAANFRLFHSEKIKDE